MIDSSPVYFDANGNAWQEQSDFLADLINLTYTDEQRLAYLTWFSDVSVEFGLQSAFGKSAQMDVIANRVQPSSEDSLPTDMAKALLTALEHARNASKLLLELSSHLLLFYFFAVYRCGSFRRRRFDF